MMTRRHIIRALAIGLSGMPGLLSPTSATATVVEVARLRELLRSPRHARAIGMAALRRPSAVLAEADPASLVRSLFRHHPALADDAPLAERRAIFEAGVAADFATGRTVLVDGWLLSRSETELFMLEALH
ncbi:MAG: hypothetical protein R3C97_00720 [Geminicoccaceae bacterium]